MYNDMYGNTGSKPNSSTGGSVSSNMTDVTETLDCERQQIHVLYDKGRAVTQITLDDDYNLADYKPDILKIIGEKGHLRMEEVKAEKDLVRVRGVLCFEVLYRSAREDGFISHLKGELPFQDNVRLDGAEEYDTVCLNPQIEDLSIGLINSRKLEIRSLITIQLQLGRPCVHNLAVGLSEMAADSIQTKKKEITVLELLGQKKDTSRFREELSLPSNKPSIQEVLWYSVQPRGIETQLAEGEITVTGELLVHMVYKGQEESEQLQCLELAVPMQTKLTVPEADAGVISWVRVQTISNDLESVEDFDGEERLLNLETVLEIEYTLWQERMIDMLQDVYDVNSQLRCVSDNISLQQLLVKNDSRFRINERLQLDEDAQVMQICSCVGNVQIDDVTLAEGHIEADGILQLQILYIASDDELPMRTVSQTLPFHEMIEVAGLRPDENRTDKISFQLDAGIDQLTTALLDQHQIECKAQLRICALVFENHEVPNIDRIEAAPADADSLQNQPGIIGYVVKKGDTLWQIAKNYRVTIPQLMELNGKTDEELQPGEKLMIVKTIG